MPVALAVSMSNNLSFSFYHINYMNIFEIAVPYIPWWAIIVLINIVLESIWPTVLSFLQQMGVICCLAVSYKNKKEIYTFLFLPLTLLVLCAESKIRKRGVGFFIFFFFPTRNQQYVFCKNVGWEGKSWRTSHLLDTFKIFSLTIFHKLRVHAHSWERFFSVLFILHPWNIRLGLT